MADSKLSALTALVGADVVGTDLFYVDDISVTTSKKIEASELRIAMYSVAATQAQMETGTSLVVSVVPGVMQYHPGVAKAWIVFDGSSGSIGTGAASYNMDAVTDNGAGDYTINFTADFSSGNYVTLVTVRQATSGSNVWSAGVKTGTTPAVGAVTITMAQNGGVFADNTWISVTCFGDQ